MPGNPFLSLQLSPETAGQLPLLATAVPAIPREETLLSLLVFCPFNSLLVFIL